MLNFFRKKNPKRHAFNACCSLLSPPLPPPARAHARTHLQNAAAILQAAKAKLGFGVGGVVPPGFPKLIAGLRCEREDQNGHCHTLHFYPFEAGLWERNAASVQPKRLQGLVDQPQPRAHAPLNGIEECNGGDKEQKQEEREKRELERLPQQARVALCVGVF
jgi:hypothetical protein